MALPVAIESVCKSFGGRTVLDGIDLEAEAGRATVILGPSGCGKTTLLRLIAGLSAPDSGCIRIGGTQVSAPGKIVPPWARRVGMVFQSIALWPHMTVEGNLKFVRRSAGGGDVQKYLSLVGLENRGKSYPSELSGGEQQRVGIARALVSEPEILLLDEPLSSLDAGLRWKMLDFISGLRNRLGVTAVMVTHDRSEALAFADKVVVMNAGRLLQQGPPAEIYERPATKFVASFLGHLNLLRAERLPDGSVATALGRFRPESAPPSGPLCAMAKPSEIRIRPPGTGIPGKVLLSTYTGGGYLVRIEAAGSEITAESAEPLRAGEEVGIEFEGKARILKDDEERNPQS